MSAKPKRSDVVLQCAHAACECWSAYSKRPVSQKIFYRVLASLESSLPAHFAGRKAAKDDGLNQLEFEDFTAPPKYFQPELIPMTGPLTSDLPMVNLDGDKEEAGVPVQMFHTEDEPRSCEEACLEPKPGPEDVLGVPGVNRPISSEEYWG